MPTPAPNAHAAAALWLAGPQPLYRVYRPVDTIDSAMDHQFSLFTTYRVPFNHRPFRKDKL